MTERYFLAALALAALTLSPVRASEESAMNFKTVAPDSLDWQPIPDAFGAKRAITHGDPSKPGTYVVRVHFPAGAMDLPHFHSGDRHVTVLSGVWLAGTGPDFDPAKAARLEAGSYMFHPAGGVHWDGAAPGADAIVQIIGEGPVETTQAHEKSANWVRPFD